jgi:hypothetical protein
MSGGIEPRLISRPSLFDPCQRQPRRQDRQAEPAAFAERGRRDRAAPERQVRELHRAGPQFRHPHLKIPAAVRNGAAPPQVPDDAAPAVSWRGIFSVHTWIAVKPRAAPRFTRYEVLGFGIANGAPAVRIDRMGPDN